MITRKTTKPSLIIIAWTAIRPKTLMVALATVFCGLATVDSPWVSPVKVLVLLAGVLLFQIASNLINDYYDYKKGSDGEERQGPLRVCSAGWVHPPTFLAISIFVLLLAFASGLVLAWWGGWVIVLLAALAALSAYAYTGGPYPLGYHGWGDLFAFLFFGPVAVWGVARVFSQESALVAFAGAAPGFYSLALLTINNIRDREQDEKNGKKTSIVRWGETWGRWQYTVSLLFPVFLLPLFLLPFGNHPLVLLAPLVLAVPTFSALRTLRSWQQGPSVNALLGKTAGLMLLYGSFVLFLKVILHFLNSH